MSWKKIALLFLLICVVMVLSIFLMNTFEDGRWHFNNPSFAEFPVRGIDISHHQGKIDWKAVAASGARFAYVKATEGGNFRDKRFAENSSDAKRYGLICGAYHFFIFGKSGAEQADNFIATVCKDSVMLPPVIDFESSGSNSDDTPIDSVFTELKGMYDKLREYYGVEPVIYVTHDSYDRYLDKKDAGLRFWIRDIITKPNLKNRNRWIIWQYAANGRIEGIADDVDLDVFNGSEKEFAALTKKQ